VSYAGAGSGAAAHPGNSDLGASLNIEAGATATSFEPTSTSSAGAISLTGASVNGVAT